MNLRLIHWNAVEAAGLIDILRAMGHEVEYAESLQPDGLRALCQTPLDAFVIDLTRLPSQGREVATYLRGRRATRRVPIVFVDGAPDKVEAIRNLLPDANYATRARLRSVLRGALAMQSAHPVVPRQMMDRYAERTAPQKLGIRSGTRVALIDPPRNYAAVLGKLPAATRLEEAATEACAVTLWFLGDAATAREALPRARRIAGDTRLWLLWQKGSREGEGGITQQFLRETAAEVGLVDYRICSVNDVWSAMLFARKKG